MNGVFPALIVGLLFTVEFLLALAAYSLRDFSRSRLSEICSDGGREKRFGEILRRHETTLFTLELFSSIFLIGFAGYVFLWLVNPTSMVWESSILLLLGEKLLLFAMAFLVFVVILPWTIARVAGERFLFSAWPALSIMTTIARPVMAVVQRFDGLIHRMAARELPENGDAAAITDEIRTVVEEGQREGVIESEARSMINRVMELRKDDTAAIMTPRTDMVCIRVSSTVDEARLQLLEAGHSRIPIIGETTDDIIGILYAKDLLKHIPSGDSQSSGSLRNIVREPYYVPESTGIDTLLENMKRKRVHIAIVIDEYGGVAGLVSMEDILEEIVGEIVDEYDDAEETGILNISPDVIDVESRVHIDDLNEQFDFGLPEDGDFETIGGFIFHNLGRVPVPEEQFVWQQLRFTVKSADQRSIHMLRIECDRTLIPTLANES